MGVVCSHRELCTQKRTAAHTIAVLQRLGESIGQLLHLGGNGQINELVANVHHEAAEDAGVHLCCATVRMSLEWREGRKLRGPWC